MGCDELGEGGLDRTGAQCEADAEHRVNHVVQAESFRADGAGQENTVEKSQNPAGEAGSGQKQRAGQKGTLFIG